MKLRKITFGLLLTCAATATSCFGSKSDVSFWSPFGSKYATILDNIFQDMGDELGFKIGHKAISGYPNILKDMTSSATVEQYPDIAVGYPDHFVTYQSLEILRPLTQYFSEAELSDYVSSYMDENYFYDTDGSRVLYGIPFNKSTELLGYNGVFIDYCVQRFGDQNLRQIPATWGEWASTDPNSNAQRYKTAFYELIATQTKWYATQATDGTCTDFSMVQQPGQVEVFDYTGVSVDDVGLFSYDSTDNAFITFVRQWGSHYTELPSTEYYKDPGRRKGKVLFANNDNLPTTIEMLKFFNRLHQADIFTMPELIGDGKSFSSAAFEKGKVMFMICSSGGLGYNTGSWQNRFRLAPVPYKDADKKFVISQGANLCLTDASDDPTSAVKVMKALTTGKYQTRWTRETGYFPASNSTLQTPEYQAFLASEDYSDHDAVAYREGARVNANVYSGNGWNRFVDDAFVGSAKIREAVTNMIPWVLANVTTDIENDAGYIGQINRLINTYLSNNDNIIVDKADALNS